MIHCLSFYKYPASVIAREEGEGKPNQGAGEDRRSTGDGKDVQEVTKQADK